jgi:hypothetical protein
MLVEVEGGGEEVPSLVVDLCLLDARFNIGKVAAFGHCIAMD